MEMGSFYQGKIFLTVAIITVAIIAVAVADEAPMARSSWDQLDETIFNNEQDRPVLGGRLFASLNLAKSASEVSSTKEAESFLTDAQEQVKQLQQSAPIYRHDSGEVVGIIKYRLNDVDSKQYIPIIGDEFLSDRYEPLFNKLANHGARTLGVSLRRIVWVFDLGEVSKGIREAQHNLRTNASSAATQGIAKIIDDAITDFDKANNLVEARYLMAFAKLLLTSKNLAGAQYAVRGALDILNESCKKPESPVLLDKLTPIRKKIEVIEANLSIPPLQAGGDVDRRIQVIVESLKAM